MPLPRKRIKSILQWLDDVCIIAGHIWHMAIVKRHFRAAFTMLCLFRTLLKHHREKTTPGQISPFVYVMQ